MNPDEPRPPSSGHDIGWNHQPMTTNPDAPTRATTPSKPEVTVGPDRVRRKSGASARLISKRLAEIRRDLFGDEGIPTIAEALHLPPLTWMNYERGVVMPATVLLCVLDLTSADPHWLLTGRGPKYLEPRGRTRIRARDDRANHG